MSIVLDEGKIQINNDNLIPSQQEQKQEQQTHKQSESSVDDEIEEEVNDIPKPLNLQNNSSNNKNDNEDQDNNSPSNKINQFKRNSMMMFKVAKKFNLQTYEERKQQRLVETLTKEPNWRKSEEIDSLISQTEEIQFFKNLIQQGNSDLHRRCCQKMRYEYYPANSLIFKIGTYGNKFYIIIDGKVGIYIRSIIDYSKKCESKQVIEAEDPKFEQVGGLQYFKELTTGQSFGELALLERKPRAASILSHSDVHLGVLMKEDFDAILKNYEEYNLYQAAMFFDQVPPFSKWNQRRQINLHLNTTHQNYLINQEVYQEGSDPIAFYIIKSGTFAILKKQTNKKKKDDDLIDEDQQQKQTKPQSIFQEKSNQVQKKNQSQKSNPIQKKGQQDNKKQVQKTGKRPQSTNTSKSPSKKNSLVNLTPAQLKQYQLSIQPQEVQCLSEDEDEQDVLLKKHDLFAIKQKDAQFQKPIKVKIAELGQYSYFGEEEIILKCKKRVFSIVCTSAYGELIIVSKRDFELRVLTDSISKKYFMDQLTIKEDVYRKQLEKIGISMNIFNNYFFDSKLELNREKLSQKQVEKTVCNRDLNVVKKFIIGIDYIEEIADNSKKKNHYHKRIAKNELNVDDLINGTFIKDQEDQKSKEEIKQEIPSQVLLNDETQINNNEDSILTNEMINQSKNRNSVLLNTLFPSSLNNVQVSCEKSRSQSMYQSKRIHTSDRTSISIQHEFQITEKLMHQDIQEKLKEKFEKVKHMEESFNQKSSAFRKSSVIDQQLKIYRERNSIVSQPNSLNSSFSNNNTSRNDEDDCQKTTYDDQGNKTKGGFWKTPKKMINCFKMQNNSNLKDSNLQPDQSQQSLNSLNSLNHQKLSKSKSVKKPWTDSYTLSFQETLKKNLQEKFKDQKINGNRIKKHLKQDAIALIPDEEFQIIPESLMKKPTIVIPEMDEKVKLFKRVVMKCLGVKKSNSTTLVQELKDNIKQNRVQSIRDGFLSHLQNSLHKNDAIQSPEQSNLIASFSRSNSIRGHHFTQSQNQNISPFIQMTSFTQQSNFKPVNTNIVDNSKDENNNNNNNNNVLISLNTDPIRRLKTAAENNYSKSPSIFESLKQPNQNLFLTPSHSNNITETQFSMKRVSSSDKPNSSKIQMKQKNNNSQKGYSFYESKQKQLYQMKMKSNSSKNLLATPTYNHLQRQAYPRNQLSQSTDFKNCFSPINTNNLLNKNSIQNQICSQYLNSEQPSPQPLDQISKQIITTQDQSNSNNININSIDKNNSTITSEQLQKCEDGIAQFQIQINNSSNEYYNNEIYTNSNSSDNNSQNFLQNQDSSNSSFQSTNHHSSSSQLKDRQYNSLTVKTSKDNNDDDKVKQLISFPSNDIVKEDISKNDKSQISEDDQISPDSFSPISSQPNSNNGGLFSPIFSPILSSVSPSVKDKFLANFSSKTNSIFKKIYGSRSKKSGLNKLNNEQDQETNQKSESNSENDNSDQDQENEEDCDNIEQMLDNQVEQSQFKNMSYRFQLPQEKQINENKQSFHKSIIKDEIKKNNSNLPSPSNKNTTLLGQSTIKKLHEKEYDSILIEKHIKHKRFFSLMTDQLDDEDKNHINLEQLKHEYKQQQQNPFFLAHTVDDHSQNNLSNQRKLVQKPQEQFKFQKELQQQYDDLLKQMNMIQQAEKQIQQSKQKTNTMFIQPQKLQAMTLESIVNLQKNIHRRNKTEMPSKLTTKQTQSPPLYKFQAEKLYYDKVRHIKAKQQSDEIQRKNEFFHKISKSTQPSS